MYWHYVLLYKAAGKKRQNIPCFIPKEILAFLLLLSIFFLTWRANDSSVFQFADAIVLVSHFSAVKIVWRIFMLTKWNINWSLCAH